jgi:hypothetical protein
MAQLNPTSFMSTIESRPKVWEDPIYAYKSSEARTFLAGGEYFQLSEIEVYEKKLKIEYFYKSL